MSPSTPLNGGGSPRLQSDGKAPQPGDRQFGELQPLSELLHGCFRGQLNEEAPERRCHARARNPSTMTALIAAARIHKARDPCEVVIEPLAPSMTTTPLFR